MLARRSCGHAHLLHIKLTFFYICSPCPYNIIFTLQSGLMILVPGSKRLRLTL